MIRWSKLSYRIKCNETYHIVSYILVTTRHCKQLSPPNSIITASILAHNGACPIIYILTNLLLLKVIWPIAIVVRKVIVMKHIIIRCCSKKKITATTRDHRVKLTYLFSLLQFDQTIIRKIALSKLQKSSLSFAKLHI